MRRDAGKREGSLSPLQSPNRRSNPGLPASSMVSLWLVAFVLLCAGCLPLCVGRWNSSLTTNGSNSITGEQLLVSQGGGKFALGFFTPADLGGNDESVANASSQKRYVGIWYNHFPEKTVVWVANREKPVVTTATTNSGILKIADDGNIKVLDGDGRVVLWSSNVTGSSATTATLLDTGNLVLTKGLGNDVIWQSFDYPTDTLLPGMNLRFDLSTGVGWRVVAWKTPREDPSPGEVSIGFDPKSPLQFIMLNGTRILWRWGLWNGRTTITSRKENTSSVIVQSFVKSNREIYYSYAATEELSTYRMSLDAKIGLITYFFETEAKKWTAISRLPHPPCDLYEPCGPFGTCDSSAVPPCKCLQGFHPKNGDEWEAGNFTSGCVRETELGCGGDFVRFKKMGFPGNFTLRTNLTASQCEEECRSACHCLAYAYANLTDDVIKDLRCFLWYGKELKDLKLDLQAGGDLYVRLAHSDNDASQQSSSNRKKRTLIVVLPILLLLIIILVLTSYFLWKSLKAKGQWKARRIGRSLTLGHKKIIASISAASQKDNTVPPLLDFSSISVATNDFSLGNKLGEGGFGPVYKGNLLSGQEIAVKRLSKRSGQGFQEFKNEIEVIGKLQHTNLVRLLGWCASSDERILIYEYLPNKSLDKFIFDPMLSRSLNWKQRYSIIDGISQGLLYLHKYSRLRIIHRDLKTSNILLDHAMNPKISDFGLARIFGGNQMEAKTRRVVGTYGYMAPEYAMNGHFSEKSDVFSFGVIVLEIITGKRSTGYYPYKESSSLLEYVWKMWKEERVLELVDQSVDTSLSTTEKALRCIQLGLVCVEENAMDRPSMSSVVSFLSNENAILPSPGKPAFVARTQPDPTLNKRTSPEEFSLNELTISVAQGR